MSKGRRRCISQSEREWERERENSPSFTFLFSLDPQWIGWFTNFDESGSLHSVYSIKCQPLPETPSQTHQKIIFYQLPRLQLTHKINHHSYISGNKWQSHKVNKSTWQLCHNTITMPRYCIPLVLPNTIFEECWWFSFHLINALYCAQSWVHQIESSRWVINNIKLRVRKPRF